ncbi:Type 1 glutamine amidotransferase-like domain-containing protein [Actinacidiphila rubida]|uniref:Dipeptidase E n=1 Tax=Actinacidiphila rubida TaxID=310780 RepID=A0A1H8PW71_9ACTN|nr:Type 1 glutamine amidotransferase-like domain-containing protein [Actinacidiphila rubida]SEO45998.1 dipeptidase E [Actinacidiphila rubida]
MRLLLTSAGIKNATLHDALVDLLGKPLAEADALCVPTATHAMPGGPAAAWRQISGRASTPLTELGWKSMGVLELTALPSVDPELWVSHVRAADALLVGGGDPLYLAYWMRQSGLADLFPSLDDTVYVGVSAGSMVLGPRVGEEFVEWRPSTGGDATLGVVDFSMFPHLDHEALPANTMADAEKWAARLSAPAYAIDDQTALTVVDGAVEVVSEGHWKHFAP